jgi:hypothetical protein
MHRLLYITGLLSLGLVLFAGAGWAVTIDTGDGTGNVSAPADDPGWSNVGYRTGENTSVVYLGDRWVLTASHVGAGTVFLNGAEYERATPFRSYLFLQPDDTRPDLVLFRLKDRPPGLPTLTMDATGVSGWGLGTEVVLVGHGYDREPDKTYWTSTWGTTVSPGVYSGYRHVTTHSMRWGTNRVTSTGLEIDPTCGVTTPGDSYCKPTKVFSLVFNSGSPTTHEARVNSGDSGGGVFRKRTGSWHLTGIIVGIDTYSGQPTPWYIPYGTSSFAADLSVYRDEILAVIAANPDTDDDGILDSADNCPTDANEDQLDSDGDGEGDVCDTCPDDALNDDDGDGWCGDIDLCPDMPNPADNADTNGDGIGDACQCGDVNMDGSANNDDVTEILLVLWGYGSYVSESTEWGLCDVSDDGACNNNDVTLILMHLWGYDDYLPANTRWQCPATSPPPPGA